MVELAEVEAALPSEVVDLAASLSIAAEIDNALLRTMRRALHPALDHEAEAVLYHSALATNQGHHGFALSEDLLPELQLRLTEDGGLERAHQVLLGAHAVWPLTVQLEEQLIFELLSDSDGEMVSDVLRTAVTLLRDAPDRRPVARWLLRALRRAPARLFDDDGCATQAFSLVQAASAVLGGTPFRRALPASAAFEPLPVLTDRVMPVGVRLGSAGLVFTGAAESITLPVPLAWPVVLSVEGSDGTSDVVTLHDSGSVATATARLPALVTTINGQRTRVEQRPSMLSEHGAPLDAVAWSQQAGVVVVASAGAGWVRLVDSATGQTMREIGLSDGPVGVLSLSADGTFVAFTDGERQTVTWRDLVVEGVEPLVQTFPTEIRALSLSGLGHQLAVAEATSTTVLTTQGAAVLPPSVISTSQPGLISPGGDWLAAPGEGFVEICDAHSDDGSRQRYEVDTASFAPTWLTERLLAVPTVAGVEVIDAIDPLYRVGLPVVGGVGVAGGTHDGRALALSHDAGSIEVWDLRESPRSLRTWSPPPARRTGLAWSPDGTQVAVVDATGGLCVWATLLPALHATPSALPPRPVTTSTMQLTVLPAGYGTSLVLELAGPDRPLTIVIDGGPKQTYAKGLRAFLARREPSDRHVDVLAVSHSDAGVVDGVIELLRDVDLGVTIGDVWCNGFEQLPSPDDVL